MKTIKYGSVFGNFRWDAEAEIDDEMLEALAPLGALQIAQRSPSTAAEKELAGYDKRPKGFSRNDIPYSVEGAEVLKKHLVTIEVGEDLIIAPKSVTVIEYVPETVGPKFAEERKTYTGKKGDKVRLQALANKVGFAGDIGDGTGENAPEEFLRAMRDWKRAALND